MINNDVPLAVIRRLLDHSSTAMTEVSARLNDQTLKREWEKYNQRINIRGEVIAIDSAGPVSEAASTKQRLARAKQPLPDGYCALPLQQSCPHPNACLTCDHFLTTEQFLPVHVEQLTETERLITHARAEGSETQAEDERCVRLNLVRVPQGRLGHDRGDRRLPVEQVRSRPSAGSRPLARGTVTSVYGATPAAGATEALRGRATSLDIRRIHRLQRRCQA